MAACIADRTPGSADGNRAAAVANMVERQTRFVMLVHVPGGPNARTVRYGQ